MQPIETLDFVAFSATKPIKAPPWCSRADWVKAYPELQNWHWLAGCWPASLSPSSLLATQTVVVEHPWQARWLKGQWAAMHPNSGAQIWPHVVTLNGWLNEYLAMQYPQAVSEQTAAISVWRAVQSLKKNRTVNGASTASMPAPTPGRWRSKWWLYWRTLKLCKGFSPKY
jgi:hypothetical protein